MTGDKVSKDGGGKKFILKEKNSKKQQELITDMLGKGGEVKCNTGNGMVRKGLPPGNTISPNTLRLNGGLRFGTQRNRDPLCQTIRKQHTS